MVTQTLPKFRAKIPTFFQKHKITVGIVCSNLILWFWLVTVNVSVLSQSVLFGRLLAISVFVLIVAVASTGMWLAYRFLARSYRYMSNPGIFLALVFFVWAFTEWIISWLVTIIWYGPGGSVDSVLPFSSLTPWLMHTPFGILSRVTGYYGLSALFVTLLAGIICKKTRLAAYYLLVVTIIVGSGCWLLSIVSRSTTNMQTVTFVSEKLGERVPPIETSSSLVVLPEYGMDNVESGEIHQRIQPQYDKPVYFIGSQLQESPEGLQNVLLFGSTDEGYLQQYPKTRLIPGGEYLPYGVHFLLRASGNLETMTAFQLEREIAKGSAPVPPIQVPGSDVVLGSEACASIIAPEDYRRLARDGATVLTNSASLGIFQSSIFNIQHNGLSRFMASANDKPFIQATSDGKSFALNNSGQLLVSISPVSQTDVAITPSDNKTIYTLIGDWPVYVGGIVLISLAYSSLQRRRRNIKD